MQPATKKAALLWIVLTAVLCAGGWAGFAELQKDVEQQSQAFRQIVSPIPDR